MSIAPANRPLILSSFINDPHLFEPRLLSGPIAKLAGSETMAALFNSIEFHPDFQDSPQLKLAHQTFVKESASQAISKIKTAEDASAALKQAVVERNPVLLNALLAAANSASLEPLFFDDSYTFSSALYDFASCGDIPNLQKFYDRFEIDDHENDRVLEIVVTKGHMHAARWLLNKMSFSIQTTRQIVFLAKMITSTGSSQRLAQFLQLPHVKNSLKEPEWDKIIGDYLINDICRDILLYILDPNNQIPISSKSFRWIFTICLDQNFLDITEDLLSSARAQLDPTFILIALANPHSTPKKYYKKYLDKYFHLFQINCIFTTFNGNWDYFERFIRRAMECRCFNILKTCIEYPGVLQAATGCGCCKNYILNTSLLLRISDKCKNLPHLKQKVDEAIAWRKGYIAYAMFKIYSKSKP